MLWFFFFKYQIVNQVAPFVNVRTPRAARKDERTFAPPPPGELRAVSRGLGPWSSLKNIQRVEERKSRTKNENRWKCIFPESFFHIFEGKRWMDFPSSLTLPLFLSVRPGSSSSSPQDTAASSAGSSLQTLGTHLPWRSARPRRARSSRGADRGSPRARRCSWGSWCRRAAAAASAAAAGCLPLD